MKKMRNKKGFSLAEMMIVIAIIVILAGATAVGVVSWLNNAKNAQNNVLTNNGDNFENEARLAVETANGTAPYVVGESATVNPVTNTPAPVTNTPKPDPDPVTNTPKPDPVTNTPKPDPVTNTPKPDPVTNTPKPDPANDNSSNGMTIDLNGNGKSKVTEYSTNGNTTTFTATDLGGNGSYSFKITKQGNDYIFDMDTIMWQINYRFPGYNYNGNQSVYTLNSQQKAWLTETYGISFS